MGAPIAEIFEKDGEDEFREFEAGVLDQVHSFVRLCIATGGGIVMRPQNWGKLQTGVVIWLDCEPDVLVERLSKDPEEIAKRPLLKGEDPAGKLAELLEQRRKMYAQADVTVEIGPMDSVSDVITKVIDNVSDYMEENPPQWQQWKDSAATSGLDWVS